MDVNSLTILSLTQHGVPSGNYDGSSLDFDSDGAKGVGYYRGQGSIQTVYQRVTGFVGTVTLQATLDQNWQTAQWVDVNVFGDGSTPVTGVYPATLTGNYTWLRARITDFSAGSIDSITVMY
jgi:hypothetical protein